MHFSYILHPRIAKYVCVLGSNYYLSRIDKEIEAQRGLPNKSAAEWRFKPRPSANSTSLCITLPSLAPKSIGDTELGAMVSGALLPIPKGLKSPSKENRWILFTQHKHLFSCSLWARHCSSARLAEVSKTGEVSALKELTSLGGGVWRASRLIDTLQR